MSNPDNKDQLFHEAVKAIDAGDLAALKQMLREHPWLATESLNTNPEWLRQEVGKALDGFFNNPYLLWFVTEDPVRNKTLPANIVEIAAAIIHAAKEQKADSLQEQLDYAVRLTGWSNVAKQCGVQLSLINLFLDEGATPSGANDALVCSNTDAAALLIERGAPLTLAASACLNYPDETKMLAAISTPDEKQAALVLAALNGKADGMAILLESGADPNRPCPDIYSHGTPLHHAVCSGSLEAVKVLVNAGANVNALDTAWQGTPEGWALHYYEQGQNKEAYKEIVLFLRSVQQH